MNVFVITGNTGGTMFVMGVSATDDMADVQTVVKCALDTEHMVHKLERNADGKLIVMSGDDGTWDELEDFEISVDKHEMDLPVVPVPKVSYGIEYYCHDLPNTATISIHTTEQRAYAHAAALATEAHEEAGYGDSHKLTVNQQVTGSRHPVNSIAIHGIAIEQWTIIEIRLEE